MNDPVGLVSVVIPTKNEERNIGRCLDALFAQKKDRDLEVIVIDSGSTDRTLGMVAGYDCRLIQIPPEEFGHGRTRNLGAEEARGDLVVYLVADAFPASDLWLHHLLKHFDDGDARLAGVYGRQAVPSGRGINPLDTVEPPYPDGFRVNDLSRVGDPHLLPVQQRRLLANFDDVTSCIRREVLLNHPFPDVPFAEDMAWAWHVLQQGYTTIYEPQAVVYHYHRQGWNFTLRRHYLDQVILLRLFDTVLLPNGYSLLSRIWSHSVDRCRRLWRIEGLSFGERCYWSLYNVRFVTSAALGHYLAGWQGGRSGGPLRRAYNRSIQAMRQRVVREKLPPMPPR